ncbi:MAG: alpha/beta hydrolase, partial [Rhodospirillales bacterium]|nr:alpha/beta hydrolase [Rhodospirillales bacterium]
MTSPDTPDLTRLIAHPGAASLTWHDSVFPDRPLRLHAARPRAFTPDMPVLFVLHGVRRNGEDYRDFWLPLVDDAALLAISIEFPEASFPDYLWYNFGNLHAADGTPNPSPQWTFGIPDRLFQALRAQGVTRRSRYGLFGHSAGGQFVHRMLSFGWRDRVAVAVGANAGTYAMPDLETAWPFGLGETLVDAPALRDWLGFPLTVMAGTEDTRTTGRHFPKGPRSMRQGPTRYARAHRYVELGHAAAAR